MKNHRRRNFILNLWAEQPFWHFMAIIVCAIFLLVLTFSSLYYLSGPFENFNWKNLPWLSDKPFLPCLERSFLELVTLSGGNNGCQVKLGWLDKTLSFIEILFGLFFFASIVAFFTGVVLRPKVVFELKSCLNVKKEHGRYNIIFSVYNASPVTINNLHVRIVARVQIDKGVLRNIVLRDDSPRHPLAEPYIPLRIPASLSDNNISITSLESNGFVSKLCHQRSTDTEPLEILEFYADISGVMVGIEQSVHASKRYRINQNSVFYGLHHDVEPDYPYARDKGLLKRMTPPKEVKAYFEKNDTAQLLKKGKKYVFGYGSLVNPESFAKTIQRSNWSLEQFPLATLQGYQRVWNTAMDNKQTIPGYKQYAELNNPTSFPDCYVCFLNIEKSDKHQVIGSLTEVTEEEFASLELRERNYKAEDVTADILHAPIDGKVHTFIGSEEARNRFKAGIDEKSVVISQSYEKMVENSFRSRGKKAHENYQNATNRPAAITVEKLQRIKIPPK